MNKITPIDKDACIVCEPEKFDGALPVVPAMKPCLVHAAHPAVLSFFSPENQEKPQIATSGGTGWKVIIPDSIARGNQPLTAEEHFAHPRGRFSL